ncbi:MAG: hypothetical protein B7Z68_09010 [Acidobacteria bacterium 21-70-11]|nr:MAG: hypothetical protein B7Z68_09010 [Acidobacteria bacterium 21-70-11]
MVDDEEDVITFLTMVLEDAGFQTESAHSVDEALEKVKVSPPDCISLDMVMPGKSGIVLFHELVAAAAGVELPEGGEGEPSPTDLRGELERLARTADPDALAEALRLLKSRS